MKLLRGLAGLLYPSFCAVCDAASPGTVLCSFCEEKLERVMGETCRRCGADRGGRGCVECRGKSFVFARAVAVGSYVGTLRGLLLKYKLGGHGYLADDLGRRLAQRVLDEVVPVDVVTAVPMRRWTRLRRGYNPAEELAAAVASKLRRSYVRALKKIRTTEPQAKLPLAKRASNPAGAYAVRKPAVVRSRSVLLVDDVLTTGATANECARVLLEAGAREVNLAVVGR